MLQFLETAVSQRVQLCEKWPWVKCTWLLYLLGHMGSIWGPVYFIWNFGRVNTPTITEDQIIKILMTFLF